tara:strand:+ start:7359 stop:7853 length:495 start_codon:yes stop_codon:yes gene_type:complete
MESPFDKLEGVIDTATGYAGGSLEYPTYKEVSTGETTHLEVVQVTYDPEKASFKKLLEVFWVNIDPLDSLGQFCDRGSPYLTAIFYGSIKEEKLAQDSKSYVARILKQPIATKLVKLTKFWPAEIYHQDYYKKNPKQYKFYRGKCGRDRRLKELWANKTLLLDI